MENEFYNKVGNDRISSRQIDELIGLARGLVADGNINQAEVEFLEKWLVANSGISDLPILAVLYGRVRDILSDGIVDEEEKVELLDTLNRLSNRDFELGETLKSTTLPLCNPAPSLRFEGMNYCFTGTFNYGQRKHCEKAVADRGFNRRPYPENQCARDWHVRDRFLEAFLLWYEDHECGRVSKEGLADLDCVGRALGPASLTLSGYEVAQDCCGPVLAGDISFR